MRKSDNVYRLLRIGEVAELLGVHVTTIHRWFRDGKFVDKVHLGDNCVGFLAQDVYAWIEARARRAA